MTCDGSQTLVPGALTAADTILGVQSEAGGGIHYCASPGAEWCGTGVTRATSATTPQWDIKNYWVSLPEALTHIR